MTEIGATPTAAKFVLVHDEGRRKCSHAPCERSTDDEHSLMGLMGLLNPWIAETRSTCTNKCTS
jgi:hypothetical protein